MLERGLNAPRTSSVGRLFDAVASLTGLRQRVRYEGQAAMELEFAALAAPTAGSYPFEIRPVLPDGEDHRRWVVDWGPMIAALLGDLAAGCSAGVIAAKFHHGLADAIVAVARLVGEPRVALSGGCFQNRYLTERVVSSLTASGFRPYWHQRIPPNDGGIALGQVVAAARGLGTPG
jgi:hydrogenase maturation protein HypF